MKTKHPSLNVMFSHLICKVSRIFLVLVICQIPIWGSDILSTGSTGWSMLEITDGVDPAIADTDFNNTWFHPTVGGYVGGSYDGPTFLNNLPAPFSYGGVDGLTGGTALTKPDSGLRYTNYFYKIIDTGAVAYQNLEISMLADDGAYVYLNGELIAEDGVSGDDTYMKLSSGGNETNFDDLSIIGQPLLKPGLNLLAVSLHNTLTTSSDLGFDITLKGDSLVISDDSSGWAMLHPMDGSQNGLDPSIADPDFNTTWHSQSFGGYSGGAYDGPAFTPNLQSPFAYGGVNGLPSPNTAMVLPNSGTRGAAYFLKEIDGGIDGSIYIDIDMLADDGAYIYLNGSLIGVVGDLPVDATQDTWGQYSSDTGDESDYISVDLIGNPALLPGSNLLAISLHQVNDTSSDLGFALRMSLPEPVLNLVRGPYLQAGAHDRMTVRWRTDNPGYSTLRYGDAPNNLTETITFPDFTEEHVVSVTGLDPATKYYYEIESGNGVETITAGASLDYYFQTHPLPGEKVPTRIWVIGDSGTASTNQINVYNAYLTRTGNAHTDTWLMLGDNAYQSGLDSEFQEALFDIYPELLRNTILWSTIGNHESYGPTGDTPYLDLHTFPTAGESGGVASGTERYYSFDHGNIHFICLDSNTDSNLNDTPGGTPGMIDWLELDLQSTDKDWIIAFFHHGPYTKGSHDSDSESHHIAVRKYMTPLLERYGVDLVLSGHSHQYERSMLINGHHSHMSDADSSSGTFVTETHVIDGGNGSTVGSVDEVGDFNNSGADGAYEKPLATGEAGTIYTICGASGKLSTWDDGTTGVVNPTPHPVFIVNLRVLGSMVLEVEGNTLHAQYIDDVNEIRDDFTLVKGASYEVSATDNIFSEFGADTTASFTISRVGATSIAEDVHYQVSGSTTSGVDYAPLLTGTVSFLVGETQKVIDVSGLADDLAEGDESLVITLSASSHSAGINGVLRAQYFLLEPVEAIATLLDQPAQAWWFDQFGTQALSTNDWEEDSDDDGLKLIEEYAYGGTVGSNDESLIPYPQISGGNFDILFSKDNAKSDLNTRVQTSINLIHWISTGVITELNGPANPTGVEQWKGSVPISDDGAQFLRLKIDFQ